MIAGAVQARLQLAELIDRALRGEDVVISRHRVPAVRLVPIPKQDEAKKEAAVQ